MEKNGPKMFDWIKKMQNALSNSKVRLLYSKVNLPQELNHVTLMVDGKNVHACLTNIDTEYRKNESGVSNLIDRKNMWKIGMKSQVLIDSRNMTILVSEWIGANEEYDGHQFKKMFYDLGDKIPDVFNLNTDNLTFDNHFNSTANLIINN
jgi:hypothetical protein